VNAKLCDLKQIGKEVCQDQFGPVLVIDYYDPPPTVELSDGQILKGSSWSDVVTIGGSSNAQYEQK
jgi:hypothetical protein